MNTNKYITKIASVKDETGISDRLRDPDFARAGLRAGLFGAATGALGGTAAGLITRNPFVRTFAGAMGAGVGVSSGVKASFKNQLRDQQVHDIKLQGAEQRREAHDARMHKVASDHMLKAYASPAWQENAIAKEHGREGLEGVGKNVGKHVTGYLRAGGRSILEGYVGSKVLGTVGGKAWALGSNLGLVGGVIHGGYKSFRNQAAEAHEKYAEINNHQAIKDGANLVTIAGLGGLGAMAASRILPPGASKSKIFLAGTGASLVADYAGLKINEKFNRHMDNKYLNKIASTTMSRNLNSSGTSMTLGGGDAVGSANRARMGAMVGGGASGAGSRAANANAGHVSSGFLNRSVDSGKVDRLATTNVHERLADARANLKLSPANGDRMKQIANASAIRNSKPGAAGSLFGQGSATSGAANSNVLNKGLVDAKAGYQAHTEFSKKLSGPVASLSSSAPPAVAKEGIGLLGKARALMGTKLGKGLAIGGAALGVGALAHSALKSNNEDRVQYSYG